MHDTDVYASDEIASAGENLKRMFREVIRLSRAHLRQSTLLRSAHICAGLSKSAAVLHKDLVLVAYSSKRYSSNTAARPLRLGTFLSKYGINLTKEALDGKLSPAIGRSEVCCYIFVSAVISAEIDHRKLRERCRYCRERQRITLYL